MGTGISENIIFPSEALKMEAISSIETSVSTYETAWRKELKRFTPLPYC
jgi:hypothetical protein